MPRQAPAALLKVATLEISFQAGADAWGTQPAIYAGNMVRWPPNLANLLARAMTDTSQHGTLERHVSAGKNSSRKVMSFLAIMRSNERML